MSNRRVILRLLAAAALLVGAHAAITFREGETEHLLPRTALAPDALSATFVAVARTGAAPAVLAKDGAWRLVAPYAAGVEDAAVLRLLDALASAPLGARQTDAELLKLGRTRADYGLDPARLALVLSNGVASAQVFFGTPTPDGSGVYAAVGGDEAVFIAPSNALAAADLGADDLRCRALVAGAPSDVAGFDLKQGTSLLKIARAKAGWTLTAPDRPASAKAVGAFLDAVYAATAAGFVWPLGATNETKDVSAALLAGYGLDAETAVTATFRGADGTDHYVSFGQDAGDGRVYALVQDGAAIATVPAALKAQASAGADVFADLRLFPAEAADVTSVSVSDGETRCLLARDADGAWRLDAPVSAPADADAAKAFVAKILTLRASDRDAEGPVVAVGTNDAPVAVSRAALFAGFRLEDLRAKTLVDVAEKDVRRIAVTAGGARTALVRDAETERWSVEDGDGRLAPDRAALAAFLGALAPLDGSRVVALKVSSSDLARYGLAEPRLVAAIDFTREDALRRNILVGDATEDGGAYATVGSSDAVFVLPEAAVRALSAALAAP